MVDAKRFPPGSGHLRTVRVSYLDGREEHFDCDEAPKIPHGVAIWSCSLNRPIPIEDFLEAMEKANG